MVLTQKATDRNDSEYREIPDGFVGRFIIGEPKLRAMEGKYGRYWLVDFPLELTESEQKRLIELAGEPPDGVRQSWRPSFGGYGCSWTLKPRRDGSWLVVDLMAAAFGAKNARAFRDWIAGGACPPESDDYTEEQNVAVIESWLKWIENMELYAAIHHTTDDRGTKARATNFMPIGSLPGQPEPKYQADAKEKLRLMMQETGGATGDESESSPEPDTAAADSGEAVTIDPTKLTPEQQEQYRKLFGQPVGAA